MSNVLPKKPCPPLTDTERTELSRRTVLRLGAGAAAFLPLVSACTPAAMSFDEGQCDPPPADGAQPAGRDYAQIAEQPDVFDLAVVSGAVTATGAILSTHVTADVVRARVWRRDESGANLLVREETVTPVDGFVRWEPAGLASNTQYEYAFFAGEGDGEQRSAIGRFRTAYGDDCRRAITVAATSCTNQSFRPFTALERMAQEDIDLVLQLGDFSYNDGCRTREEFRARWRQQLTDPGYRKLLGKAALYATWDDHEFTDNAELYSLPPQVIETARDAYFEHVPMPRLEGGRLWQSFKWGQTAEFFVLDSRLERQPDTRTTDRAIYLGEEQMEWFKQALKASTAHFKVVLNSVPMIYFPPTYWPAAGDRWQGYESQREEILDFITDNAVENVWFLSGDFHLGIVARLEREGPRSRMWEILCGPGGNGGNPLGVAYEVDPYNRDEMAPPDQFKFFTGRYNSTLLTFDAASDSVHVKYIDGKTNEVMYEATLSQKA